MALGDMYMIDFDKDTPLLNAKQVIEWTNNDNNHPLLTSSKEDIGEVLSLIRNPTAFESDLIN